MNTKLGGATTIASLVILVWMGWSARADIATTLETARVSLLMLSTALGVAFLAVQAYVFALLVSRHTDPGPKWPFVWAFLISQPSKYLPGKIWPALVQSAILGKRAPPAPVTLANLELYIVNLLHLLALGYLCLVEFSALGIVTAALVGPITGALIIMAPTSKVISRFAPGFASKIQLIATKNENLGAIFEGSAAIAASMVLNLIASYVTLLAICDTFQIEEIAGLLAILYLSNILSGLVVIIPAGIGIRELAAAGLGALMFPEIAAATVITVALVFRLWQVFVDGACFGAGWLAIRFEPRPSN